MARPTLPLTAITRPPPTVMMITIRLRPREEAALPPPPPAAPTAASHSTLRFQASVDVGSVLPPAPEGCPPSAAAGAVEGKRIRTTTRRLSSEDERLPPPPTLSSRTTTIPLRPDGEVATLATVTPSSAGPWSDLLPELLLQVACRLRPSRLDLENMRAVCPAWRMAIPSTRDPFLVLSRKEPSVDSEVHLLEIAHSTCVDDASFKLKTPLSRPPSGTSCWGSALGLIALQCHHGNPGDVFVYCIHCAEKKTLLSLPPGATPKAIFLEPLTPQRFVFMRMADTGETVLRVEGDDYPWRTDGGPWWLPAPGFNDMPLTSMALYPGVFRAGANRESIIIIDESGRCLDSPVELVELQTPPLFGANGSSIFPWEMNGHHLFICEGQLHFMEIYDSPEASEGVGARLFQVEKSTEGIYSLLPVSNIGMFSVYVGANQSFVLPSHDPIIGRLSNTFYVEDFRGHVREPRVLAINFDSLATTVIPYPHYVADTIGHFLPAVWAALPEQKDIVNHCTGNDCWRFWD